MPEQEGPIEPREFDDGLGGETVCAKCGIGAMTYTLSLDI